MGIQNKSDFMEKQKSDPFLISMGINEQKEIISKMSSWLSSWAKRRTSRSLGEASERHERGLSPKNEGRKLEPKNILYIL